MFNRVESDENGGVLLANPQEELLSASCGDAVPKNFTCTYVDGTEVDDGGENGSVGQELVGRKRGLLLVKHLSEDGLAGGKSHRNHVEKCSSREMVQHHAGLVLRHRGLVAHGDKPMVLVFIK